MRKINKTKSSNIKCEHCKHWNYNNDDGSYANTNCACKESPKYNTPTKYWNRCRGFEWKED